MEKEVLEAAERIGEYVSILVSRKENMKLSAIDRIARSNNCQELLENIYHAVRIARTAHRNFSLDKKYITIIENFLGDGDKKKVRTLAPIIGLYALSYHEFKKEEGDEE